MVLPLVNEFAEFAAAVFQVKPNGDVKRLEAAGLLIEQQLEWGA